MTQDNGTIRKFATGATRDTAQKKLDPDGFLSPLVIERYSQYLDANRLQSDGSLRDSDNWQKGIPQDVYRKSAWRHFLEWWKLARGWIDPSADQDAVNEQIEVAVCGLLFNVMGWLHERLAAKYRVYVEPDTALEQTTHPIIPRETVRQRQDRQAEERRLTARKNGRK